MLSETGNYASGRNHLNVLGRMLPYLWPKDSVRIRLYVLISLGLLVSARGVSIGTPYLFKLLIDNLGLEQGTITSVLTIAPMALVLGFGLARILSVVLNEAREWIFVYVVQRVMRKIGQRCFVHLHALSLRFHLDRKTGGLARVIERGVKAIEWLLSVILFNTLPTLIELAGVCIVLWALFGIQYVAIVAVTLIAYIWLTFSLTEWRLKFRRQMNAADELTSTRAVEGMLNYETVKYFNNESYEAERYDQALRSYERGAILSIRSLTVVNVAQGAIFSLGLILLLYFSITEVRAGTMTIGDVTLVHMYMMQIFVPLDFLGWVYRQLRQSLTDMDNMVGLLDHAPEIQDPASPLILPDHGRADVFFKQVTFSYDQTRTILQGVDFTIQPGENVAIVGRSGSGKTTISRLLCRFFDVTGGSIQLYSIDLRHLNQHDLRQRIGVVPQDTVLFNDSIAYNIQYGRPSATLDQVLTAADQAGLTELLEQLPDRHETLVGERGLKLSGGEKQRVAIARTILKDPHLLLLDEATSALDTKTERAVQKTLVQLAQNRTTLMIAHRLSTIVHCDRILVLADGQISEAGSHDQLLAARGVYAELWQQQSGTRAH